jgi:predicted HicB family RNase H-like nuclease
MNSMSYDGYTAKIEFDERDNIFVGHLLGMRTMISFHGETVVELRQGVKPEKPASGKLMLRVSPEIHGAALIQFSWA